MKNRRLRIGCVVLASAVVTGCGGVAERSRSDTTEDDQQTDEPINVGFVGKVGIGVPLGTGGFPGSVGARPTGGAPGTGGVILGFLPGTGGAPGYTPGTGGAPGYTPLGGYGPGGASDDGWDDR